MFEGYMFCSYLRDFNLIKLLLEIKSSFPVAKWALKVHVNLLNQHCKPAEWLTDWLTDWLADTLGLSRHSNTWGTRALEGHLGTRSLKVLGNLRHSGTRRALGHSGTRKALGHLGSQALGHSDTWKALGHLGTEALGHLGTRGIRGTLFSRLHS